MTKNEADAIERAILAAAKLADDAVKDLLKKGKGDSFLHRKIGDAVRRELSKVVRSE